MLKKKINFRRVEKKLINDRVDKLRLEANNIEVGIIKRTLSGRNKKNGSFKPYSTQYATLKRKAGSSSKVNLTGAYKETGGGYKQGGTMLQAISNKRITNGLRFYFNTSAERKKAFYNNRTREFFGMDKVQVKYLKRILGKL